MSLLKADASLVLKITPPRISRSVLERPRLSSTRPEFAEKTVVALHAVSGSGKTSLLAQWRKEALQAGSVVAWLTLDARDDDSRFVLGLTAAMRASSGRQQFGQACLRAIEVNQAPLEAVTEWLAEVTTNAAETLLMLDDVHELPGATVNSALVYLLLNAPSNLKILLSSRQSLALPISELPARGRYVALSASDLRFDLSETVALLKARFGQRIDLDSCVRLHEITEGWPLGVQLAVSTIERSESLQQAIAGFAVRASDIQRYFVECLVDRLPSALAQLLVRLSFVDALSPSLCEAITQQPDTPALLEQLCRGTPIFTHGLSGEWVRMHSLAREFLLERFAQLAEPERRDLHLRAADWLEQHRLYEEAARHLLQAGRPDQAYDLVERCLHDLLVAGQVALASYWVERLPSDEIMRRTPVRLTVGWMLAQSEQHGESAQLVEAMIDDAGVNADERCEAAEICATAAVFADDIDGIDRIISPWLATLATRPPLQQLVGLNHMAYLALLRGSPDQARRSYAQFSADEAQVGRYPLGWRDWIVGISYLWEGQVHAGAQKLKLALARAEIESGRRSPIAVMLASALAAALWDCDRTDETAAVLANRFDILERRSPPDALIMGFLSTARLEVLAGREQRALVLLDELQALGQQRRLPRLCIASVGERIRLHALHSRGTVCAVAERHLEVLVSECAGQFAGLLQPLVDIQVGLARAYAAIARLDWKGALERLGGVAPIAERLRRGRDCVEIYMLQALAKKRCGEDGTGLLKEAIGMARIWGLARVLADTHPDLPDWARQLQSVADAQSPSREDVDSKPPANKPAPPPLFRGSLLSPKEREVLRLLASNMSNKQIALAMGVSSETIKWHVKNLFGKLNAGTRRHLVDRARMAGLLDSTVAG